MTDVTFSMSADFDRKLIWDGGKSVRYLVARLKACRDESAAARKRTPLNIALVIDASGSMDGGKLEAAKKAALGLAERLTEQDRLSVISFSSDVQVHLDGVAVTAKNRGKIVQEISKLEVRGMTCLSDGWFAGVECAAKISEIDSTLTPRIIILSDGHANEGITDPGELREHAAELRLRGVLTSTLGIGDGYDEQLLQGIAESGGGRLHDAEHAVEISSVLLGELDDIFGTVIEDTQVTLTFPHDCRVEFVGSAPSKVEGNRIVAEIGPLQHDVARAVVFKVTCPRLQSGAQLDFSALARGRSIKDDAWLVTETGTVTLVSVGETANNAQPRDSERALTVARTWSADILAKAANLNSQREFARAEAYTKEQFSLFKRYVEGLAAAQEMIDELEILTRHIGAALSSRMHKEMVLCASVKLQHRSDHRPVSRESWSSMLVRE